MNKFLYKIVSALEENGSIEKEHEEVYLYVLNSIFILGANLMISLLIGIVMGLPLFCILFLGTLIPLRSSAGGYHAGNWVTCHFLSCATLVLTLLWIKFTFPFQSLLTLIMAAPAGFFVFLFALLDDDNKPLGETEKQYNRKKTRITVSAAMLLGVSCLFISEKAAYAILGAVIWCGFGYGAWFIKNDLEKFNNQ